MKLNDSQKYNILYVDDEESNLRVFSGLYRRKYNLYTSTSVEYALDLFCEHNFHLVVSDQRMPGVSGIEFLTLIKKKNPHIPTILLTGYTDQGVLKEAFNKAEVHMYVNKPFEPDSLAAIMDLSIERYVVTLEKERVVKELKISENRYRNIFDSMAEVFIRADFEGVVEVVSPSLFDLCGYEPRELLGKNVSILYDDPSGRKEFVELIKRLELVRDAETIFRTKTGQKKWISSTSKLYYNTKGEAVGVESIIRDISERKEMQDLLREQNEFLDETQRLAKIGSWNYDPFSNELKFSDTLLSIYGVNDLTDAPNTLEQYLNFFQHSDQIKARKLISKTLEFQNDFSFEATIVRPDQKKRILSFLGKVVSTNENQLKKITVACLDVTEIRTREKELIKSEEKFRLLTEQLPVRVLKIDNKLNILFANKLAYGSFYNPRKGKEKVHSFFDKNALPEIIETINNAIDNGKESYLEYESKNKWYALKISVVSEPKGLGNLLLFIDDITHKKASEELLKNMNEKLEGKVIERTRELREAKDNIENAFVKEKELSQLKSQFVSTASHQFRTPLTVIQSNIGLLEMQVQDANEEFRKKFDRVYHRIESEVGRMTDIMDNVMILGKKESGHIQPKLQSTDVLALVNGIVDKYNEIQEDGRSAEVNYKGSPSLFRLDPQLFENAFSNLVSNAFKYSALKPPPIVQLQYKKGSLCITIQDFGVGIPERDQQNIFEPFYRSDNVKDIAGTGLGTSIVKAYIELMGGRVGLKSKVGEGTTFSINLVEQ